MCVILFRSLAPIGANDFLEDVIGVLGEFLFMQQLASEKVHCSVISMNSC